MVLKNVPLFKQKKSYTCGPTSLKIVFEYFGYRFSEQRLTKLCGCQGHGFLIDNNNLVEAAKSLGFMVEKKIGATIMDLKNSLKKDCPIIVNYLWNDGEGHFSVVVGVEKGIVSIIDTYTGELQIYKSQDFCRVWKNGDGLAKKWMMVVKI